MTSSEQSNAAATRYGVPALIAIYVLLRAWNLQTFCLDWDEVFSVSTARFGWGAVLQAVANDLVHPPLSYLLLKVWIALGGTSLLWLRLLPFVLSVAALVPLLAIFRALALTPLVRTLVLALVAVNEYQCYHARYVRMYGLLFLLGLTSLWLFLKWLDEGGSSRLWTLAAVNVLLVYTHYFGWMLILAEGVALLGGRRKQIRDFAIAGAAVAAAFVPWALAVAASSRAREGLEPNLRHIQHPGLGDLTWFYAGLGGPLEPIPLAAALLFLWLGVLAAGRARGLRHARVLVMAAIVPPVASFALSAAMPRSVWGSRHLILSAVPFMILLAASAAALRPEWVRRAVLGLMAVWIAWGAALAITRPAPHANIEVLARQLEARCAGEREVTIYSLDAYVPAWMGYYLEGRKWHLEAIADLAAAKGDRFWLAYNEKFWHEPKTPQQILRERGYETGPGIWAADPLNRFVLVPIHLTAEAQRTQRSK